MTATLTITRLPMRSLGVVHDIADRLIAWRFAMTALCFAGLTTARLTVTRLSMPLRIA